LDQSNELLFARLDVLVVPKELEKIFLPAPSKEPAEKIIYKVYSQYL
jgi:hypothetical protein